MEKAIGASVTRVERTFAFLDISEFTNYTDQAGDAAAVAALATFRTVVRDACSHNGVRIDKWLGDGAMLVGVDTAPLVHAVLDIASLLEASDFPLPLRAGMSSGLVILFEAEDYIGTPVNLASRLCSDAAPGEILATEPVAAEAPTGVGLVAKGKMSFRGLAEALHVVALTPAHDEADEPAAVN